VIIVKTCDRGGGAARPTGHSTNRPEKPNELGSKLLRRPWICNSWWVAGHDVGVEDRERRLRLEALYAEHAAAVHAYAQRRIDVASAEDIVMEVFVIACRRLDHVPAQPLPWLLGCARRLLANQRRGAQRADALIERLSSSRTYVDASDPTSDLVWLALAQLRERDREILLLSAWEELNPGEIAQVLGCTRAAAAVRLHRARTRLAAAIQRGNRAAVGEQTAEVIP
jgi:RNA polymerase sigma-70 factor (ECF subfamily)